MDETERDIGGLWFGVSAADAEADEVERGWVSVNPRVRASSYSNNRAS